MRMLHDRVKDMQVSDAELRDKVQHLRDENRERTSLLFVASERLQSSESSAAIPPPGGQRKLFSQSVPICGTAGKG